MGGRDARHGRALFLWLPVALVVAVVAAGVVAAIVDPPDVSDESGRPAAVPPPPGLDLPDVVTPAAVATAAAGAADPARVRRALAGPLRDPDLGPHVVVSVTGLDGTPVYSTASGPGSGGATPASTLKLLTATAALEVLGPDHRFATTVVADGPGRVVLVGGGDPLLSRDDLRHLARRTARQLEGRGHTRVRVGYDTGLFTGPDVNPHWPPTYVPENVVSPIQPLWVDEGRAESGYGRVADPAASAAQDFAAALGDAGVTVLGSPAATTAPRAAGALARVASAPLDRIVEHTLATSDNEAAEVLARHVGLAVSGRGSFAGGVAGVLHTLDGLGLETQGAAVYDGSGLSREDRLDPALLTAVLDLAGSADHPELRSVVTGLPVGGFTGSLEYRFDGTDAGRGVVRAKTGTLSGVSGLAGIVTSRDGTPMVFAVLADRIALPDTLGARAALVDVTDALAACRCGA